MRQSSFNIYDDEPIQQIPINSLSRNSNNSVLASQGSLLNQNRLGSPRRLQSSMTSQALQKSLSRRDRQLSRQLDDDFVLENDLQRPLLTRDRQLSKQLDDDFVLENDLQRPLRRNNQFSRSLEKDDLELKNLQMSRALRSNNLLKHNNQLVKELNDDTIVENDLKLQDRQLTKNLFAPDPLNTIGSSRNDLRQLKSNRKLEQSLNRRDRQLTRQIFDNEEENKLINDVYVPHVRTLKPIQNNCSNANIWTIKFRLPGNIMISHDIDKTLPFSTLLKQLKNDLKHQGGLVLILPALTVVNCELSDSIEQSGIQNYNTIVVTKA